MQYLLTNSDGGEPQYGEQKIEGEEAVEWARQKSQNTHGVVVLGADLENGGTSAVYNVVAYNGVVVTQNLLEA